MVCTACHTANNFVKYLPSKQFYLSLSYCPELKYQRIRVSMHHLHLSFDSKDLKETC